MSSCDAGRDDPDLDKQPLDLLHLISMADGMQPTTNEPVNLSWPEPLHPQGL